MSHRILYKIIGTAITDPEFCGNLINERRSDLLTEFDLTDEEHDALMAIDADSLQEFSIQLETWLQAQEKLPVPVVWQQRKWFDLYVSSYVRCQGNSEGGQV